MDLVIPIFLLVAVLIMLNRTLRALYDAEQRAKFVKRMKQAFGIEDKPG